MTGAGPHAGDTDSPRNGLDPATVSQVHAASVYLLVALTVALLVVALRGGHHWLARMTGLLLLIEVLQGVLGWVQYWPASRRMGSLYSCLLYTSDAADEL